ncbi:MAG: hypothetical protein M3O09_19400 [Acidobacteriota bacterium]|nr:hypothetical protein [Acidobacteriota bacterium]
MPTKTRITVHEFRPEGHRRTPVTEDWLVDQDARRRAALRDLQVSQSRRIWGAIELIVVWVVAMGLGAALIAGAVYAGKWLLEAL